MKSAILELLKKNQSEFISGEEISISLEVSRTAIWKHIQSLREDGYVIDSQPRNGYKLIKIPDRLYPDEIMANLNTSYMGQTLFYFDTTTSTNDVAKELAAQGFVEGTVVIAEKQSSGKGRLGRKWTSPHGQGLWFSFIMRPDMSPAEAPKFTLMAGVAVAEAINYCTGIKSGIKWPNDIYVDGKKVCGILTEMNAEMDTVNYIVVGIGINVNINKTTFTGELKETATSVSIEKGQKVNRIQLLQEILRRLEKLNAEFAAGDYMNILHRWKELSVTINNPVTVTTMREQFSGIAVDVDQDGALLVEKANGQKLKVLAGDVTLAKAR